VPINCSNNSDTGAVAAAAAASVDNKNYAMKRAITVGVCQLQKEMIQSHSLGSNVQRQLLAEFNKRNESESSTSPER